METASPGIRLDGRVAVVTGAAQGIGRAIAQRLAAQGAHVVGGDIDEAGLSETVASIEAIEGFALAQLCDVTQPEQIVALFDAAERRFGLATILVNNAFLPPKREHPEHFTLDNWEESLRVNLTGYFLCAREAGARLITSASPGSIVNISSIAGSSAMGRGNFAYSVGKSGVNMLTRELAIEWGGYGIRVNAIQPCQTRTPAFERILEDPAIDPDALMDRVLRGIPAGRMATPEEIAWPAAFLVSDAASMITGAILPVDGGNLAMNAGGSHSW